MVKRRKTISVIVPCLNEEENILPLYNRLQKVFRKLPLFVPEYIFVDNNSPDGSEDIFTSLAKRDKKVKVIFMSRNFGSPQPSFVAGLTNARGDAVILLQGDIQDPPELIPAFIKKWGEGYDIVYGTRIKRRGNSFLMNIFYKVFYVLLKKLSYLDIPMETGDFSLLDRVVVNQLLQFPEVDYHLRGLRAFVGFRHTSIPYVRDARTRGKSTENFFSSLWWAKTIIVNFSLRPLALVSQIAFMVMLFTLAALFINIFSLFIFHDSPRGVPTIILLILFLGAIQMLSLSIIAEYLGKIFLEVKGRPRFIIRKLLNIKKV